MATKMKAATKAPKTNTSKKNVVNTVPVKSPKAKDSGKKSAPMPPMNFQTKSLGAKQNPVAPRVITKSTKAAKVTKSI